MTSPVKNFVCLLTSLQEAYRIMNMKKMNKIFYKYGVQHFLHSYICRTRFFCTDCFFTALKNIQYFKVTQHDFYIRHKLLFNVHVALYKYIVISFDVLYSSE